jgi:hypothetical protein
MNTVTENPTPRNPYPCRKCGRTIYWHKSRNGKHYPTDSATDRAAFHQCGAQPKPDAVRNAITHPPKPVANGVSHQPPITPDYFEHVPIEQRVADLETAMAQMARTIAEVQRAMPITNADLPEDF